MLALGDIFFYKLGDIVTKSGTSPYIFKMNIDSNSMGYRFSRDTTSAIKIFYNSISRKEYNSVFVPAKEVLSLYSIILKSREIDHSFGFDDTYYDLTKALRIAPKRIKNFAVFAESRTKLKDIVDGKVELDESTNKWYYKSGKSKYTIGATSEGIKKIAILDRLLANPVHYAGSFPTSPVGCLNRFLQHFFKGIFGQPFM